MIYKRPLIVLALLTLAGCKNVDLAGSFKVEAPFKLRKNSVSVETIQPGEMTASVGRNKDGSKIYFEIREGKKKHKGTIDLPKNTWLPKGNGDFFFRGGYDIDQEFDLRGDIQVADVTGPLVIESKTCDYHVSDPNCYGRDPRDGEGHPGPPSGHAGCSYVITGTKDFRYRDITHSTQVILDFTDIKSATALAHFDAKHEAVERSYEHISECHR